MVVVGLLGPRYAGKRTIAELLAREFGFSLHWLGGGGENVLYSSTTSSSISEKSPPRKASASRDVKKDSCTSTSSVQQNVSCFKLCTTERCVQDICDDVSQQWSDDHVVFPITCQNELDVLSRRPQFLLVSVEAPIAMRYERGLLVKGNKDGPLLVLVPPPLLSHKEIVKFQQEDDEIQFGDPCGREGLIELKSRYESTMLTMVNDSTFDDLSWTVLKDFQHHVSCHVWTVLPWDDYFMQLARLTAKRSNCLKKGVGALLVKHNRIIATGYNGTASGLPNCYQGGCPRCANPQAFKQASGLDYCECLHAEANAVLEAGREKCMGCCLYVTSLPCLGCAKQLVQGEIARIVYQETYDPQEKGLKYLQRTKIQIVQYKRSKPKLIQCSNRRLSTAVVVEGL